MTSFRIALAISNAIHLAVFSMAKFFGLSSTASAHQGHYGVLHITLKSSTPAAMAMNIQPSPTESQNVTDAQAIVKTGISPQPAPSQTLALSTAAPASSSHEPLATAHPALENSTHQHTEGDDLTTSQDKNNAMRAKKTHPGDWLAIMVQFSPEGVMTEYRKVSTDDPNSFQFAILVNQIKSMTVPESLFGKKILVSGPPLKIETDPELIAEYF